MKALFDLLVTDYTLKGNRSLATLPYKLLPLRREFDTARAYNVTGAQIDAYKAERLATRWRGKLLAPATVNRELAALRRAFNLGVKKAGLDPGRVPQIEMLPESDPREGFIEPEQFEAVVGALPDDLQDLARFGYVVGWRSGALKALRWEDVDRKAQRVFLRRERSKNRKPYVIPLRGDLAALIERRWEARTFTRPEGSTALSEWVFHRAGRAIGDFGKAWTTACLKARLYRVLSADEAATTRGVVTITDKTTKRTITVKTPHFHDLRRSAARNLRRAGFGSVVGKKITGHETDAMWRRYSIVDEVDIEQAIEGVQKFVSQQAQTERKVVAFPQRP